MTHDMTSIVAALAETLTQIFLHICNRIRLSFMKDTERILLRSSHFTTRAPVEGERRIRSPAGVRESMIGCLYTGGARGMDVFLHIHTYIYLHFPTTVTTIN
jgi:hypothetical protein